MVEEDVQANQTNMGKSDIVKWKTNFFIVDRGMSTAATNTLASQLAVKEAYEKIAFICRSTEDNHNNLKKCIEHALSVLHRHFIIFTSVLSGTKNCDSPKNSPIAKPVIESTKSFVDLTAEADEIDSEDEKCHDQFLREQDEDYIYDYILDGSDMDGEEDCMELIDEEIEKSHQITNFRLSSIQNAKHGDEDVNKDAKEYEKIVVNSSVDERFPKGPEKMPNIYENFRPELFGQPVWEPLPQQKNENLPEKEIKTAKKMISEKLSFSSNTQQKYSFSSINHPQINRPTIKLTSPHHQTPKSQLPYRPQLNRGNTSVIELPENVTVRRRTDNLPNSSLFTKNELRNLLNNKALPQITHREQEVTQNYLQSFKVPKKTESDTSQYRSSSVLDDDYNGPQPRRPIHLNNSVNSSTSSGKVETKYSEPKKNSNPKFMETFAQRLVKLIPINESPTNPQADRSTPSSLKTFFGGSQNLNFTKDSTNDKTIRIEDSDDDVKIIGENENVRMNREVRVSKRLHPDSYRRNNRNSPERKFFNRKPSISHQSFSNPKVPKYDKTNSQNTTVFYKSSDS